MGKKLIDRLPNWLLKLGIALTASFNPAFAQERQTLWEKVASTDVIAIGTVGPIKNLDKAIEFDSVAVPINVLAVIKGRVNTKRISVPAYLSAHCGNFDKKNLRGFVGKRVYVFLNYNNTQPNKFWFLNTFSPFESCEKIPLTILENEIDSQVRINAQFESSPAAKADGTDRLVRILLGELAGRKNQLLAWDKLLALKKDSMSALVRNMKDYRSLHNFGVSIDTPDNPIEGIVHYGPKTVFDAVTILLQHSADGDLPVVANGGTAHERLVALRAWHVWAYRHYANRK